MAIPKAAPGRSPAGELLRLIAAYLAAVLALQGVAAAVALGRGPLHSHRDTPTSIAALVFSHHEHQHRTGERHFHTADDASVVAEADDSDNIDAAAFALTAALALLAWGAATQLRDRRRHVWHAAAAWAWRVGLPGFLFKPPRMG